MSEPIETKARLDLPVLDKAAALGRMGGDEELYAEILELFLDDAPKQLEILSTALRQEDRTVAQRQAHSLKSAAGNVGGTRMALVCEQFERNALQEPFSALEERKCAIEAELQRISAQAKG